MTNDEGGSITPENRIKQLEERLVEESDRLEKLYVAYRKVEQELEEKNAIIDVLEKEAIDKEIEREGMETLLSDKDNRIHEMEMEGAKSLLELNILRQQKKCTLVRKQDSVVFSKWQRNLTKHYKQLKWNLQRETIGMSNTCNYLRI